MASPRQAFAVHAISIDAYNRHVETTFVTLDHERKRPVGWVNGYLPDGAEWNGHKLTLLGSIVWTNGFKTLVPAQKVAA